MNKIHENNKENTQPLKDNNTQVKDKNMSQIRMRSAVEISKLLGMKYEPTPEQIEIIQASLGSPILVIAGAGAGKTEVMSSKIVYMVTNNLVKENEILALTFADKAKQELDQRIKARLKKIRISLGIPPSYFDEEYLSPQTSTYNAFAYQIVKEHGYKIGISPLTRLITDGEIWQIIHHIIKNWKEDLHEEITEYELAENIHSLYQQITEQGIETKYTQTYLQNLATDLESNCKSSKKIAKKPPAEIKKIITSLKIRASIMPIVQAYIDYKKDNNLLDYSDQIKYAQQILNENPQVIEEYRQRYKVVLLDEYQDTSSSQIKLLSTIFKGHDVIAVGDPKQAIYGWRGATIGAIEDFEENFDSQDNKTRFMTLSVSWRNSKKVLEYANTVSSKLYEDIEKYSFEMPKLKSHKGTQEGKIDVIQGIDPKDSFELIAKYIKENKKPNDTVAIISRRKTAFVLIQKELTKLGIKSQKVGLDGLLEQDIIKDLIAFLKISSDSAENKYLIRILDMLNFGVRDMVLYSKWTDEISKQLTGEKNTLGIIDCLEILPEIGWYSHKDLQDIELLNEKSNNVNKNIETDDIVLQNNFSQGISEEAIRRLKYVQKCVQEIRKNFNNTLEEQIKEAINITGLDLQSQVNVNSEEDTQALQTFIGLAKSFETNRGNDFSINTAENDILLPAFLNWLEAAKNKKENFSGTVPAANSETVQIMSIHASKGLEWDMVIVPELVEGVFPSKGKIYDKVGENFSNPYEKERTASEWLTSKGSLPYSLRTDSKHLPYFDIVEYKTVDTSNNYVKSYKKEIAEYMLMEELRLAYVAFTRAKHTLVLSGYWFAENATTNRKVVSRYLHDALHECKKYVTCDEKYFKKIEIEETNTCYREQISYWPALDYERIKNEVFDGNEIDVLAKIDWSKYELVNNYDLLKKYENYSLKDLELEINKTGIEEINLKQIKENLDTGDYDFDEKLIQELQLLLAQQHLEKNILEDLLLPNRLAATSVINRVNDRHEYLKNLRRPLPKLPNNAARLGNIFHDWVKLRSWDSSELLTLDEAGEGPSLSPSDESKIKRWKNNFLELDLVKNCEFIEQEIQYELPINYIDSNGLEHKEVFICRIDAVLKDKDGKYIVIDWKTGQVPQNEKKKYLALQLGIYKIVWAENNSVDLSDINACFVYVDSNEIVYLDDVFEGDFDLEYLKKILSSGNINVMETF